MNRRTLIGAAAAVAAFPALNRGDVESKDLFLSLQGDIHNGIEPSNLSR